LNPCSLSRQHNQLRNRRCR